MTRPTIRDRSAFQAAERKLELIAPEEIGEAICRVVESSYGIGLDDLPQPVCRLLGFGRTSEDMVLLVRSIAAKLANTGRLEIQNDHLTLRRTEAQDDRPTLRIVKPSGSGAA